MICPACQRKLTALNQGGVRLDVCHGGCGGMWFDRGELDKLNGSDDSDTDFMLNIPVDTSIAVDDAQPRKCPRCKGAPTLRQQFVGGEDEGVRIDSCASCEGTWLDHGELEWVQSH